VRVRSVSGAGKTEANKIIMQYLCWRASHSAGLLGRKMVLSDAAVAAAEQLAGGAYSSLDALHVCNARPRGMPRCSRAAAARRAAMVLLCC
jgi:hypothetical protein